MAAKRYSFRNDVPSSLCFICIWLLLSLISTAFGSTTTTPVTTQSSTESTTDNPTTTEPTTTTAQVQTTTPIPVDPPTPIASNVDIGQCPCDLTGNACDVNCCCDTDCNNDDRSAFSECLPLSSNVDKRMCIQKELILSDNSPLTTEYSQSNLFCVYLDNYSERNYYTIPDFVTTLQTFNDYRNRYAGPTFTPGPSPTTTFTQFYKYGDPVYVIYERTLSTGFLRQPTSLGSTQCSDDNPVAYLTDSSFGCQRLFSAVNTATCENQDFLKASTYYQGFRVVSTPYLFSYIVNGTVVTTPAPITAAPTQAETTGPTATTDPNATVVTTAPTTVTTTVVLTTQENVTNTTEFDSTVVMTTEAPIISDINLYNNTYVRDLELSTLECRDVNGNLRDCNFNVPPDPTLVGTQCNNAVVGVEYVLTHRGTDGIQQAQVKFVLRDFNVAALPLTQTFTSTFRSEGAPANTTDRSGNPGYVIGKPVRAGVLLASGNTTAQDRYAIVESLYDLTLVKSTATGTCASDAANRIQVSFGENVRTGCLISLNLDNANVTEYCSVMQQMIINALEGMNNTDIRDSNSNLRRVATFGNSDVLSTGDWVQIIREGFPSTTVESGNSIDRASCRLSMGMHIEILYAKVGALANPQPKIVGVAFKYESLRDVTYTCTGSYCTPGNTNLDQVFEVSQSVSFIDVSQDATGYVGDPPIFVAKVPSDFFYPFAGSGNRFTPLSLKLILCLVTIAISLSKYL